MLKVENVVKSFEGFRALKGVSLEAPRGCVTGLIGPNGSGKSTLFNCITGITPMDSGQVSLYSEPLDLSRPDLVARKGVMRTFQVPRVAMHMTVLENLLTAPQGQESERLPHLFSPRSGIKKQEAELRERGWNMLDFLGMARLANHWAGTLSGGQLKLLSLGMVLMADPAALLLDEPVAGVNPAIITRIMGTLEHIRAQNKVILIIEHNIELISQMCESIYVLDAGEIISHGTPDVVRADPRVRSAYLGVKVDA